MIRNTLKTEELKTVAYTLYLSSLLPFFVMAQPAMLTDVTRNGDQTSLTWEGGEAPYQVQRSSDLVVWQDVGTATDTSELIISGDEAVQFFRVLSSVSAPNLGEYIGQLRVAEGEFGMPLARHRLKSTWDFYAPEGKELERTAAGFFESAIVKLEILEGEERKQYTAPLRAFPSAEMTVLDRSIRVAWTSEEGEEQRDYTLDITFRYNTSQRRPVINLSDPTYKLTCRYSRPQLLIDRAGEVGTTREDEVELVEIADDPNAPAWWKRKLGVEKGAVVVSSEYELGVPNIEGGPAFIFKTPLLAQWVQTRIAGLTSEPIELTSRFSQSYFPGHHNFVETLYLEPELEPGIDAATLAELREMNVRFIVPTQPTAFPEAKSTLQVIGFDGVIRELP